MSGPTVMTVEGRVATDRFTLVLPHEHTFIRLWAAPGRFDGTHQVEDVETMASELRAIEATTGHVGCVVDLTTADLGRRPTAMRDLAAASGVAIVMGTGWYREPYYRPEDQIDRRSVGELADIIVGEIVEGVDGVRPGVIGEIGVDKDVVSAQEERVHRAAARAHRATGLPIATHSLFSDVGLAQLALFEEEGVDPSRVAIGHVDRHPYAPYAVAIAERGANVMLDNLGDPMPGYEARVLRLVASLLERGLGHRILLSHDISKEHQLRTFGGRGYSYLAESFIPQLRSIGCSDDEIQGLILRNPLAWLVGAGSS